MKNGVLKSQNLKSQNFPNFWKKWSKFYNSEKTGLNSTVSEKVGAKPQSQPIDLIYGVPPLPLPPPKPPLHSHPGASHCCKVTLLVPTYIWLITARSIYLIEMKMKYFKSYPSLRFCSVKLRFDPVSTTWKNSRIVQVSISSQFRNIF